MDKVTVIIPLLIGVLIFRQFIPKEVNRFDFIGLPILGLYKTCSGLPETLDIIMITELIVLLIWAGIIGYYQARKTKVVYHQDRLSTVGGIYYIIAWVVLLIGRMIILIAFHYTVIIDAIHSGRNQFTDEIIHLVSNSEGWLIWSTVAASSFLYSLTLYRNHPEIKGFIHSQLK